MQWDGYDRSEQLTLRPSLLPGPDPLRINLQAPFGADLTLSQLTIKHFYQIEYLSAPTPIDRSSSGSYTSSLKIAQAGN